MKNILITGAAQGIGYYMVEELLKMGFNVTVLDLKIEPLAELARANSNLAIFECDVRDAGRMEVCVRESVSRFGGVDCAVHNACLCTFDSMETTDLDTYRDVFDVNYFGALRLAKMVIPYMKKQGQGKIIFTSSGVGVMGFVNISPYASSKGALETLVKCLNIEYQDKGITFHIFHPPLTRTASAAPLPVPAEFMANPKEVGRGLARHIHQRSMIISHSFFQSIQTGLCYLFPVFMGRMLSKMTAASHKTEPS